MVLTDCGVLATTGAEVFGCSGSGAGQRLATERRLCFGMILSNLPPKSWLYASFSRDTDSSLASRLSKVASAKALRRPLDASRRGSNIALLGFGSAGLAVEACVSVACNAEIFSGGTTKVGASAADTGGLAFCFLLFFSFFDVFSPVLGGTFEVDDGVEAEILNASSLGGELFFNSLDFDASIAFMRCLLSDLILFDLTVNAIQIAAITSGTSHHRAIRYGLTSASRGVLGRIGFVPVCAKSIENVLSRF